MTYEEALEIVKANREERIEYLYGELCDALVEVLEKQIPKKPITRLKDYEGCFIRYDYCPSCGMYRDVQYDSCPKCGQRIDWGYIDE